MSVLSTAMMMGGGSTESTPPNQFTFTDISNANFGTSYNSNIVTVTGLSPGVEVLVQVSGGQVDAGTSSLSGSFTGSRTVVISGSGTIVVQARVTTGQNTSTPYNCVITIRGVSDTFTATTKATVDLIPSNANRTFNFSNLQLGVQSPNASLVTYNDLEPNYGLINITVTGGAAGDIIVQSRPGFFMPDVSITGSPFIYTVGTDNSGNTVNSFAPRVVTPTTFSTTKSIVFNLSGSTVTYNYTTRGADETPAAFSFPSLTLRLTNTVYTSSTVTIVGLEPNYPLTVSASNGTIDAGTSALSGTFAASKNVTTSGSGSIVVALRGTSSASLGTDVVVTANVGTGSGTFTIRTTALSNGRNWRNTSGTAIGNNSLVRNTAYTVSDNGGTGFAELDALSIVSGAFPTGVSIASAATYNSGRSSGQNAVFASGTPTVAGSGSVTVRFNWRNTQVSSPDFNDVTLSWTVT